MTASQENPVFPLEWVGEESWKNCHEKVVGRINGTRNISCPKRQRGEVLERQGNGDQHLGDRIFWKLLLI